VVERDGRAHDRPFADDLYDDETLAAIEGWVRTPDAPEVPGLSGWRRTSATGAVLGAAMLGLGEALEGRRPRDRPPIVMDDPGQPDDPDALVDLDFDPTSPTDTVARLRAAGSGRGQGSAGGGEERRQLGGGGHEGGRDPLE
jgi:hypothetical protein